MLSYDFKIKRPFFLSNFFTRPSNLRLGEWRFLLVLVQRLLVFRYKNIFLAYLLTSSNFFFLGSNFLNNIFLRNLIFMQEVCFIYDFSNFSKKLFNILSIPFYLKGSNSLIFFDYMTSNWQELFFSFYFSSKNICNLENFDIIGQLNFLFPVKSFSILILLDLNFFRFFLSFRFYFFISFFFKLFFSLFFFFKYFFFFFRYLKI
jgi:hypothetical protein